MDHENHGTEAGEADRRGLGDGRGDIRARERQDLAVPLVQGDARDD